MRTARSHAGSGHPGARTRPPRRAAVRVRVVRCLDRVVRDGDPSPATYGGARGRGTVPHRRAEGVERDAAQAQPREVRAALRPRPYPAREPAGRPRGRRALARARHLALVGRADRVPRLADAGVLPRGAVPVDRDGNGRPRRSHVGEPRRIVRARVQPACPARARRSRADPRRGVPDRPGRRGENVGRAPAVPRGSPRGRRGDRRRRGGTPARMLRSDARAPARGRTVDALDATGPSV